MMHERLNFNKSGFLKGFLFPNFTVPLSLFCLTACSSIYGDTFDCVAGTGVPCKSISQVNEMVNTGEIGRKERDSLSSKEADIYTSSSLPLFRETASSLSFPQGRRVVRRPEKTLRVWLASHLEDSASYVGERYVYTVIEPGRWVEETRSGPEVPLAGKGRS